ncbi:hypothetical protein VchM-138_0008 [Vibrio phage vB_VchM-138]|uniref:hypothetical protein n=1 Tax=Vibrio phage vB_VchM-138 TaxID=1127518 RepID=UPI0002536DF7|nr:hypothetical protein F397_gp08 [Vibrio phage vB_VchM-138]AFC22687.1 hypothetical protein VchM-138_0008 [Vibrio phage vB_VchM-138]
MIRTRKPRKLTHNWKYVGSGCYDSDKGIRVHVGGLLIAKVENVKATMFKVDEFSCRVFSHAMSIMVGSRKRALMLYAEYFHEVNN